MEHHFFGWSWFVAMRWRKLNWRDIKMRSFTILTNSALAVATTASNISFLAGQCQSTCCHWHLLVYRRETCAMARLARCFSWPQLDWARLVRRCSPCWKSPSRTDAKRALAANARDVTSNTPRLHLFNLSIHYSPSPEYHRQCRRLWTLLIWTNWFSLNFYW